MIRNMMIVTALAIGTVSTANAAPRQGFYLGGAYSKVNYQDDLTGSLKPDALAVIGGWDFSRYFALEARIGTGASSDTTTVQGIDVDLKVKSFASLLLRTTLPVNDRFRLYALLGGTRGELEASASGFSASTSDSSAAYGIGAELAAGTRSGVSLEWGRFLSGDGYHADAITLGFCYHF